MFRLGIMGHKREILILLKNLFRMLLKTLLKSSIFFIVIILIEYSSSKKMTKLMTMKHSKAS
jgi:hypothetical protein